MKMINLRALSQDDVLHFVSHFEAMLRTINVYSGFEISVDIKLFKTADVHALVHSVLSGRLESAKRLLEAFHENRIDPFMPVLVQAGGVFRFVAPPVVEMGSAVCVMDGSHRMLSAFLEGQTEVAAIAVSGALLPPHASDAFNLRVVNVKDSASGLADRVHNFERNLFRPVVAVTNWLFQFPIDPDVSVRRELDRICSSFLPTMISIPGGAVTRRV